MGFVYHSGEGLTPLQYNAQMIGELCYSQAIHESEPEMKEACLLKGFEALAEHVDEVSEKYYRLLFAMLVQKMQDLETIELSNDAIETKIEIFMECIRDYQQDSGDQDYENLLSKMYGDLGFILLEGRELEQNEDSAYWMFQIAYNRGIGSAKDILDHFRKNCDGHWEWISA